ncbi:MAG: hypothetical protein CVV57_09535 [Tenericutes bacterium HGW-Tenericutes-2]|nr:MAG: hypothetical protein CVV57_09535 [Tenericutes bacterium HGW-Tenericutes-2]
MLNRLLKDDRKINMIILITGILNYPLGLWGVKIPGNVLNELGLDDIMLLSILFAWIISLVATIVCLTRIQRNLRSKALWIGFILNFIYLVTPGIILIWAFLRLIIFGIGH